MVEDEFRRRVLVTVNLVADDFYLALNLVLGVLAVEDHVGEEVHGARKVAAQYRGVENRLNLVREGVKVAAYTLEETVYVVCAASACALEAHVLKEMRHAEVVGLLVARAGTHHEAAIYYGRGVVLEDVAGQGWCHRLKNLPTTGRLRSGRSW